VEHGFWDPAPEFGTSIALVHSEVTEAFDEWRAGRPFTETYYGSDEKPEGIPSELADILIRVFDLAGRYGIDLDGAVLVKMNYNESRPYRHGGKLA
jgi:NTP pyrophosphatase (non-canonical NTP hydrolase)